jgi:hypothetical protein
MADTVMTAVIAAAATIAGGGLGAGLLRYFFEPRQARARLGRVMATGLWLSCHELSQHLKVVKRRLDESSGDNETRRALRKIPKNDSRGQADWFVKEGYFCVMTAYKLAVFSSWMRIYQGTVLRAALTGRSNKYTAALFQKFDTFKVAASTNTVLWYSYIDAVGERLIIEAGDDSHPLRFADFCKRYYEDSQFLAFFDQLHMFIHSVGRAEGDWPVRNGKILERMVAALGDIDQFLKTSSQNLLSDFSPLDRDRTASAKWGPVDKDFLGKGTSAIKS